MPDNMELHGNIIDVVNRNIGYGTIHVESGHIASIELAGPARAGTSYILPGFVDAHVHIESSMLVPAEFARMAVMHGTVATVSDPHEIANVLGYEGVKFMIDNGLQVPFKFHFGAPSCVPATTFETAGAVLTPADIEKLFVEEGVKYLAEMMNWPGVIHEQADVMEKLQLAHRYGLPIDGHAPGLMGDPAQKYFSHGISTDHECVSYEEGKFKAQLGVHILIREGSAAKNFDALIPLLKEFPQQIMFCSDDKHPDGLLTGHINELVARAVKMGYDLFDVLCAATLNPVHHYKLPVGLLQPGDPADFIIVPDLVEFKPVATYINGQAMMEKGRCLLPPINIMPINKFIARPLSKYDLALKAYGNKQKVRVIEAIDGQLITSSSTVELAAEEGAIQADVANDVLKIVVVNRYEAAAKPAVAFVKGFGLKAGAIAASIAHDSHNIIAIGTNDDDLVQAINQIIAAKGGVALSHNSHQMLLPLPVAGLMTDAPGTEVAQYYASMDEYAKHTLGSTLRSPFMLLSFMALLVIPELKLSDKGLFDGKVFQFTDVIVP